MSKKDVEDISKELDAVQAGEDDEEDYFEKVLKEELELPTDDDEDSDASENKDRGDKSEDNQTKDAKLSYEELESKLKESISKIDELEKAAKGRLSDTVKSRQEKAQMKSELVELKSAVSKLLEQRDNALNGNEEELEQDAVVDLSKRGIQFDEDDKAFVDLSDVDKKIESETKKTREELEALKAERAKELQIKQFNESIAAIVNENQDSWAPAYDDLKTAFKDLNDAVIALQDRLEIWDEKGAIDQDQALDLLQGSEELEGWIKSHPGIDPIKIARAFNSKVDLRSSLRDIADAKGYKKQTETELELDEKIKKAKEKPGSLGESSDKAGGQPDLLSRIANLDSESLLNISDAEAAKIEAMLKNEELKGE